MDIDKAVNEIKEAKEIVKMTRRGLMMAVSVGAGGFAALAATWPLVGFFFSSQMRKFPPVWEDVGPIDKFPVGQTVQINLVTSGGLPWDGPSQLVGAWLRRMGEKDFTVFNSKCTHLGCPVRWIATAEIFMCPCHGGVYYMNGDVAAGPPPHELEHFAWRLRNGRVEVQWRFEQVNYAKNEGPCGGCPGNAQPANVVNPTGTPGAEV